MKMNEFFLMGIFTFSSKKLFYQVHSALFLDYLDKTKETVKP